MTSFASLGLAPALVDALARLDRTQPTPVQTQAIAPVLAGRDLLARAPTGTGKTLAYGLPLLQQLLAAGAQRTRDPAALVLVPTRELAQQVGDVLRELARTLALPAAQRLRITVLQGGVSINPQLMGLRGGADIVVATPGRLLDVLAHNGLRLQALRTLVLDEADRLLALGFADELDRVLQLLPPRRQNLLFSATFGAEMPASANAAPAAPAATAASTPTAALFAPGATGGSRSALQAIAQRLLHNPVHVQDDTIESATPPRIVQRAIVVDTTRRTPLLRHLLTTLGHPRTLVFVATRHATEMVAAKLARAGHRAAALHGELSQGTRWRVLDGLKRGEFSVLVATDVAARGLDIPELALVVNHDLPRSADDHVHRIGRTGRAGATGLAISFVPPESEAHFRLIEKRQGQRVPRETEPGFEPIQGQRTVGPDDDAAPPSDAPKGLDPNGGVKGRRLSKKDKLRAAAGRAVNSR